MSKQEEWNEDNKRWAFPPNVDVPKEPESGWEEDKRNGSPTETYLRRSTISEGTSERP